MLSLDIFLLLISANGHDIFWQQYLQFLKRLVIFVHCNNARLSIMQVSVNNKCWHILVCFRAFFDKVKLEFADILEANKVDLNNVPLTFQRLLQFPLRRTLEYQKLLATIANLYPAVSCINSSLLHFVISWVSKISEDHYPFLSSFPPHFPYPFLLFLSPSLPINQQHASTDDAGMSNHRLSPYNAYCRNWLTLNFTTSDSSSDERCFLKVLILPATIDAAGRQQIPVINNCVWKRIFPNIQSKSFLEQFLFMSPSVTFV